MERNNYGEKIARDLDWTGSSAKYWHLQNLRNPQDMYEIHRQKFEIYVEFEVKNLVANTKSC